jgi:hypothetical protein
MLCRQEVNKDMETDFTTTLTTFFEEMDPELRSSIEGQDETLRELRCNNPLVGRWIDSIFTSYLLAAFRLKTADFVEMFPRLKHIGTVQRQQIIATIEQHTTNCGRCATKKKFDLEFEERFERACKKNSEFLLHLLTEDESEPELAAMETY